MYLVSIPINCDKFHRTKDKETLLDELRGFDADRVFLNFETVLDGQILLYDEALEPVTQLGQSYVSAEFFCGGGVLAGDTVRLDDIPPYGFCGFVLKKKEV